MKPSLLPLLECPACAGALELRADTTVGQEVESGVLRCGSCAREYPVLRGIPRLGGVAAQPEEARETVARFGWQWKEFRERLPEYHASFLDWVKPLAPPDFEGAIVLDAGCGMGRFTELAAEMGAKAVVGVDLSQSVEVAHEMARRRENLHVVQADLLRLPFRKSFDLVYTLGVLHHLPNGGDGFRSLLGCVRPGGRIHVWVYGYEGNEWLLRFVDPVRRALTSRLPLRLLRVLAWLLAAPLHAVLSLAYRRAARIPFRLPYAPYLAWLARFPFRHTHQVVFDHLGAPIAHYYKREEFAAWFEGAQLQDVLITSRNANSWRGTARVPA
jgi:SAM-dependent methyltransferase